MLKQLKTLEREDQATSKQDSIHLVEIMLNPPPLGMPFPLSSLYALRARGTHRLKISEQVRTSTSASFSLQLQSPHMSPTPSPVKVPTAIQQSFTELSISYMTSLTGVNIASTLSGGQQELGEEGHRQTSRGVQGKQLGLPFMCNYTFMCRGWDAQAYWNDPVPASGLE